MSSQQQSSLLSFGREEEPRTIAGSTAHQQEEEQEAALPLLIEQQADDDAETQYQKGCECLEQQPHKQEEALKWLQKAAAQNSGKALFQLGECYHCGMRAASEDAESCRSESELCWKEAIPLLQIEAERDDDAESMFFLALAFRFGRGGIDKNPATALQWFRQAAYRGHAKAQHCIGMGYQHGDLGLQSNPQNAFDWFRRSAENGYTFGQFKVAQCYELGRPPNVVSRDLVQALYWYQKAANMGHDASQTRFQKIQQEIKTHETHLLKLVRRFLLGNEVLMTQRLDLWSHILSMLASHKPAGFSPLYLVLVECCARPEAET